MRKSAGSFQDDYIILKKNVLGSLNWDGCDVSLREEEGKRDARHAPVSGKQYRPRH